MNEQCGFWTRCGRCAALTVALSVCLVGWRTATAGTVVRFNTSLGPINVELYDSLTPITVQNFLTYTNAHDYDNTFIHRSAKTQTSQPFVIQGGGYSMNSFSTLPSAQHIPQRPQIQNEFHESNLRGTIAMAKLGGKPNSATSEWFFNLGNNSFLDSDVNGAFTVFGQVLGDNMNVVDAIAALPRYAFDPQNDFSAFNEVPVRNYTSGKPTASNAMVLNSVSVVASPWQNPGNHLDVSNNSIVAPQDVLIVVNDLNAKGIRGIIGPTIGPPYLDVDGNGRIEPIDALAIVNYLNAQPGAASGFAGEVPPVVEVPEPTGLALGLAAAVAMIALGCRRALRR